MTALAGDPPPDAAAAETADLAARVLRGDRRAIARALTVVEHGQAAARRLVAALYPSSGRARLIGITGSGGVGKSSLIAALAAEWRHRGKTVGIVAVDPSSATSGGALLGDRVRMEGLAGDAGVFVRSLASRGATGGLADAAADALLVLDAAGRDVVVLETIGAGQDEVDVARIVQSTVVVEAPNLGDDVQALKAGLGEIADVYVIGKSDLPGAERSAGYLRAALSLADAREGWRPPILLLSAARGEGIAALADALDQHAAWLSAAGGGHAAEIGRHRAARALRRALLEQVERQIRRELGETALEDAAERIAARLDDPDDAAAALLAAARRA